jgi:hypothetical protein
MITVAILCGMSSEHGCLNAAFARYPNVAIFSGEDRLHLPALIPSTVTRIIDMGLGGGLGAPGPGDYLLKVSDLVVASTLSDKAGSVMTPGGDWMKKAIAAAEKAGIRAHEMPYFSDGNFNESNTKEQREHIHAISANHALAMSDETRFAAAEAHRRGIQFGVWRVMSDVWPTTLPPAARGAILNSDGTVNVIDLATSLATDPEQIQALIQLAKDGIASIDALGKSASAAAAVLADPTK